MDQTIALILDRLPTSAVGIAAQARLAYQSDQALGVTPEGWRTASELVSGRFGEAKTECDMLVSFGLLQVRDQDGEFPFYRIHKVVDGEHLSLTPEQASCLKITDPVVSLNEDQQALVGQGYLRVFHTQHPKTMRTMRSLYLTDKGARWLFWEAVAHQTDEVGEVLEAVRKIQADNGRMTQAFDDLHGFFVAGRIEPFPDHPGPMVIAIMRYVTYLEGVSQSETSLRHHAEQLQKEIVALKDVVNQAKNRKLVEKDAITACLDVIRESDLRVLAMNRHVSFEVAADLNIMLILIEQARLEVAQRLLRILNREPGIDFDA